MRAQGYDGAANMSGIHKGVQARIKEIVPTANYVHCKAHVLNLAIVHASQDPSVRTMMATIQEIAFSFHYFAKKLGKLQDELEQNQNVKDKLDGKTKIQTLCKKTCWFSRASALSTFKAAFPVIVSSLEYLQSKGDGKSGVQLSAILRFDFILPLVIVNHILEAIVPLTSMLQGVSCDLVEAVNKCQTLIRVFENERNDIAVFNCLYDEAVELAEHFGIIPSKPRTTGRQRNRANPAVVGIQDYRRVTLYIQFLDHLLNELRDRLVNSEERFLAQMLLPNNLKSLNRDHQIRIFRAYESDLQSEDQFLLEIKRWVARWDIYPSKKPDQLYPLPLDMCLEDVSYKKMTGQSSSHNYRKYPPRNGVDGDLSTMFHTRFEKNPYWWVDLGSSFSVHHVEIWNRNGTSYGRRLRELDIMVGPTLSKMKSCAYHKGRVSPEKHLILKCSKTTKGRYVKLGLRVKEYFHLMEVKVFAYGKTCLNKT
ncbi:unnamed protein product [Mytilus coruscus]|uniref:Fucolectin tachylectin-4 pentraxin-1 domain-containing protein n=1 Tax=Mytilus coruscus TaxID=42192 RepID=A0A6J8BYM8_MYTCO|nr:unnamed protein product [Mytilus coruscus]